MTSFQGCHCRVAADDQAFHHDKLPLLSCNKMWAASGISDTAGNATGCASSSTAEPSNVCREVV